MSDSLWPHGPHQALCPWGFSRQEYWSGLPCPPPGDLPYPGIEPRSPELQADSLLSEPPGKPNENSKCVQIGLKTASYCFNLWCLIVGQMGLFSQVNKLFEFFPVPVWSLSIFFSVFILGCWYVRSLYETAHITFIMCARFTFIMRNSLWIHNEWSHTFPSIF